MRPSRVRGARERLAGSLRPERVHGDAADYVERRAWPCSLARKAQLARRDAPRCAAAVTRPLHSRGRHESRMLGAFPARVGRPRRSTKAGVPHQSRLQRRGPRRMLLPWRGAASRSRPRRPSSRRARVPPAAQSIVRQDASEHSRGGDRFDPELSEQGSRACVDLGHCYEDTPPRQLDRPSEASRAVRQKSAVVRGSARGRSVARDGCIGADFHRAGTLRPRLGRLAGAAVLALHLSAAVV